MIEAEVWRVHRRSGKDAQTVSVYREHYKNIKSGYMTPHLANAKTGDWLARYILTSVT